MAKSLDDIISETLRSTYGASQPNLSGGSRGGGGDNRHGGNRGTPGYPVPPEMEDGDEQRFPYLKEDVNPHPGFFVALRVPDELKTAMALDGGEPADDLHVTLFYVKSGDLRQRMEASRLCTALFAKVGPIPGRLGGSGRFSASDSSDGKDVIYVSVDSPQLSAFRSTLAAALRKLGMEPDGEHGFTPHITIQYLDPGAIAPFRRVVPTEVVFRDLWIETGETVVEGESPLCKSPVMDDPKKDPNKGFSEWGDELAEAAPKAGIAHLEDLEPKEFLEFLRKYRDLPLKGGLEVSEKVDGSARMTFGVADGRIWTQSKNGPRYTSSKQYPKKPMFAALAAAHRALESKAHQIVDSWPEGVDHLVSEVLYTKVPNSIEYGPNVIIIHGGAEKAAAGHIIKATNGKLHDGKEEWKLTYKRVVNPADVSVDVDEEFATLGQLYDALSKARARGENEQLRARFHEVQLAVKKKLLDQLRNQKSAFGPEGGDVEGLVFRDLESGALTKLVDKDYFTALNKFMWFYRELLGRGVKAGEKWVPGIGARLKSYLSDEVLGTPATKSPAFVSNLKKKYGTPKTPEEADTLLARYVEDNRLMRGDFLPKLEQVIEKTRRELEVVRADWQAKRAGDMTFVSADGRERKMDDLVKQRTDDAFADMDATLAGMEDSLQTIGDIRDLPTRRVAMLKVVIGQRGLEKLMGHGQAEEGIVREAPEGGDRIPQGDTRLSPDDQQNLLDFTMYHYKRLKKRKVDIVGAKRLGAGAKGVALGLKDGRVLKVSYDRSEANASIGLIGKNFPNIVKVFDVFQFPKMRGEPALYGIVQERLEKMPPADQQEFTKLAVEDVEVESGMFSKVWTYPWEEATAHALEGARENGGPAQQQATAQALKVLKDKYQMDKITAQLKQAKIVYRDFHGGNVMLRGGEHVVTDLGVSESPKKAVPVMERIFETIVPLLAEAGPPPVPVSQRKVAMSPGGKHALGIDAAGAQRVLSQNAQRLAKKGVNVKTAKQLGKGTRGVAFDVGQNRVLKITNDGQEAVAANKLKDFNLKYVAKFFDVFRFPEPDPQLGELYGILQEKLQPLPGMGKDPSGTDASGESAELNQAIIAFKLQPTIYDAGYDWNVVKQKCQEHVQAEVQRKYPEWQTDETYKKYAVAYVQKMNDAWRIITKKFHIDEMVQELSAKGIKFHDYHAGNIMVRPDGSYALIDIGFSKVAGGKEPPVLEQDLRMIEDLKPGEGESDILLANAELLKAKKNIDVSRLKKIGEGGMGTAYDMGGGKVLKVTMDPSEAEAAQAIKGKQLEYVYRVYDVFKFKTQQPSADDIDDDSEHLTETYGIVQEKLHPLEKVGNWDFSLSLLREFLTTKHQPVSWEEAKAGVIKQRNMTSSKKDGEVYAKILEDRGVGDIVQELFDLGIVFFDYHSGNIMKRGDGTPVVIDLGVSRVPNPTEPPVLESVIVKTILEFSGHERVHGLGPVGRAEEDLERQEYVGVDGNLVNHAADGTIDRYARNISEAISDTVGVTVGRYQPFHRGHAEVIRQLARTHTKVIVLVAGNTKDKKNPFSYETRVQMMKDSLPDVWRKIEVYKATFGGKNSGYVPGILSDISGKSPALKGDTAVEILVGPDRFEQMKQQLDRARSYKEQGGDSNFDPELAVVKELPGVKNDDDTDRISGTRLRMAIAKDDRESAKKMLDPHLVSNPDQFADTFDRLRGELGIHESVLREDLDDIGEEGVTGVLKAHAQVLAQKGIHVERLKKLGNGQAGIAYDMGGGRVFKVTTSASEGRSSMALKGKNLGHVVRIFDVFRLTDSRQSNVPVIGIVRENLHPLPPQEVSELNDLVDLLRDDQVTGGAPHVLDFNDVLSKIRALLTKEVERDLAGQGAKGRAKAPMIVDQRMVSLEQRLRHYQIDKMMDDMKSVNIAFADYKGDNIMKRGADYVLSDPGGRTNSADPPLLEQIIETIINEIGVTFNSNAPGGSQSGLRAGSSGWSSPQGMYNDEDVKTAREEPDEFELWSDKLKNSR